MQQDARWKRRATVARQSLDSGRPRHEHVESPPPGTCQFGGLRLSQASCARPHHAHGV